MMSCAHAFPRFASRFLTGLALAFSLAASAASGELDPTWGTAGVTISGLGRSNDTTRDMIVLPGDKMLVVGTADNGAHADIFLLQLLPNGQPDPSFGRNGKVFTPISSGDAIVNSVARDSTGRLVVGGASFTSFYNSFTLVRYLPNGDLDTSFGTGGFVIQDFGLGESVVAGVAIQSDGKILAGGYAYDVTFDRYFMKVTRYNTDGSPDVPYGGAGNEATFTLTGDNAFARGVAIQPDNKLIITGDTTLSGLEYAGTARLNTDGSLDTSFAGSGITLNIATRAARPSVQPDGKILVAINNPVFTAPPDIRVGMLRYNPNGSPDSTFNGGFGGAYFGPTHNSATSKIDTASIALFNPADGRVFLIGTSSSNISTTSPLLARWTPATTTLEMTVDTRSDGEGSAVAGAFLSNGNLVVAGSARLDNTSDDDVGLVSYVSTGCCSYDNTFGTLGFVAKDLFHGADGGFVAAVSDGGKVIAALQNGFHATRFNPDGSLDASYGVEGTTRSPVGANANPNALAIQPDGRVLMAGVVSDPATGQDIATITRFDILGGIDLGFGFSGVAQLPLPLGVNARFVDVKVQPDGRIVLAGVENSTGVERSFVMRMSFFGFPDASFGAANGIRPLTLGAVSDVARHVAIQPDGKILVSARADDGAGTFNYVLARLTTSGALDPTFNGTGVVVMNFGQLSNEIGPLILQPDGKIVVLTSAGAPSLVQVAGRRLNPDGSLDTTFGSGGIVSGLFAGNEDITLYDAAVQIDGRIVIAGVSRPNNPGFARGKARAAALGPFDPRTFIARLTRNGAPDPTFPVFNQGIGAEGSGVFATVLQPYNRLVGVGAVVGERAGFYMSLRADLGLVSLTPNFFSFTDQANVPLGVALVSNAITVTGTTGPAPISVTGGSYSIGCTAVFTTAPGTIDTGQTVCVRHISASTQATAVNTTLTIGGVSGVVADTFTSVTVGPAPALSLGATQVGFGNHDLGTTTNVTVNLTNPGTAALTITSVDVSGAGFSRTNNCGAPVGVGGNCSIIITFAPTTEGPRTGQVSIVSNAPGSPHVIFLAGTGQDLSNPLGDTDGDGIPNGIEPTVQTNPLSKDNDVFNQPRLFAMQQYRDFLGREGDAGGIEYYIGQLNTGAAARANIIEGFFNSPEFQGVGSPVARLYFATFLRVPDYGGLLFQINAFRSGLSLGAIANNFTLSPEFATRYGTLDNTQYVTLLYQNILGRTPVQGEIDFHVNRLLAGVARGDVLVGFSESPEYQANTAHSVYVTMMYVGMLRRAPEQGGFDYWTAYMDAGNSGLALILGFLNAPEYHNRFLP